MTEPCCDWCEGPLPQIRQRYCSRRCVRAHRDAGFAGNKREIAERRAALKNQVAPKGCATIDEWLARGGTITVCPPAMRPDLGGIPARPSRGTLRGDGAVRSAR